jgi:hypothetical protein
MNRQQAVMRLDVADIFFNCAERIVSLNLTFSDERIVPLICLVSVDGTGSLICLFSVPVLSY